MLRILVQEQIYKVEVTEHLKTEELKNFHKECLFDFLVKSDLQSIVNVLKECFTSF